MNDYADTVAFLGQWGVFQRLVFFLLCASVVPNGYGAFKLVFLTDTPNHHCAIPDVNLTEDWLKVIIPIKVVSGKRERSRCSRYRLDVVRNLSARGAVPGRDINVTDLEQEACVDGWSYSREVYQSTIVSEFDLVCSEQWKPPFTSTIFFVGMLFGSFFSGQLSDRFGRKPVLFATMALQMVFTFAEAFSVSWTMFTILLFFNGLGQMSNYVAALVLGTEILTGNVRVLFSSLGTCLSFTVGYMMLSVFAYFLRDWRSLLLALCMPGLMYIPLWWFVPESPQWLLTQGRVEEAEAILREAAKWNKVQDATPRVIFQDYSVDKTNSKQHHNVFDLLRSKDIRITTLILCMVSFTVTTCYFGLSFNTTHLHDNPYISCFISAAIEIPAYISNWLALQYLPRRLSLISILLLGAVPLYFTQLIPQSLSNLSLAVGIFGKYAITITLGLVFTYTPEIYPTVLRSTATGTCSTFSRVGNCITPFLLKLSVYYKHIPYIIMGTLAVVSAFATLFLPETFGRPPPETIQQMHKRERIKCPCVTGKDP